MLEALLGWDERLFRQLNGHWLHPALDHLLPVVTSASNFILPLLVAAVVIIWKGRGRGVRFLVLAVFSVAIADAIGTHLFKYSFSRARPCMDLANVRLLVGCTTLPSFPSNHAVNASALATLAVLYRPRLWLPTTLLALVVGYSRVYVGVHYPLDVLAGGVLGIVVALVCDKVMNVVWPLSSEPTEPPQTFSLKMGDR
jgi:undecaprenyl-diphosphatase